MLCIRRFRYMQAGVLEGVAELLTETSSDVWERDYRSGSVS
jgi:hypothetical protein